MSNQDSHCLYYKHRSVWINTIWFDEGNPPETILNDINDPAEIVCDGSVMNRDGQNVLIANEPGLNVIETNCWLIVL